MTQQAVDERLNRRNCDRVVHPIATMVSPPPAPASMTSYRRYRSVHDNLSSVSQSKSPRDGRIAECSCEPLGSRVRRSTLFHGSVSASHDNRGEASSDSEDTRFSLKKDVPRTIYTDFSDACDLQLTFTSEEKTRDT